MWNYATSFGKGGYLQPFPDWFSVGPNIAHFARKGATGVFEEGTPHTPGGDMDVLKSFLFGRMMWNASLDPDALITQFLERYYGPAAPFVRLYMVSDS